MTSRGMEWPYGFRVYKFRGLGFRGSEFRAMVSDRPGMNGVMCAAFAGDTRMLRWLVDQAVSRNATTPRPQDPKPQTRKP